MNAHIPKPVAEEKEVKAKDEEKIAEKEGDKIGDDKDKVKLTRKPEKLTKTYTLAPNDSIKKYTCIFTAGKG